MLAVAPMARCARYLILIPAVTLALACRDTAPVGPSEPPEVVVSPNPAIVVAGGTIRLVAELGGNSKGQSVTWTTHNAAVATVNAYGVVTGVAPGKVAITATAYSGASSSAAVIVAIGN